jgi:hypothetical protein
MTKNKILKEPDPAIVDTDGSHPLNIINKILCYWVGSRQANRIALEIYQELKNSHSLRDIPDLPQNMAPFRNIFGER